MHFERINELTPCIKKHNQGEAKNSTSFFITLCNGILNFIKRAKGNVIKNFVRKLRLFDEFCFMDCCVFLGEN